MTALPQDLLDLVPNAVHVHSMADFPEHQCQGEQSLAEIIESARGLGLREVFLAEHTTDPGVGRPHRFEADSAMGRSVANYLAAVPYVAATHEFAISAGLEVNILENGRPDAPLGIMDQANLTIASLHGHVPAKASEVGERLSRSMHCREVDMIGHPQRYVDVFNVDWDDVFRTAGAPGAPTIIEANFNAWFTYGPVKLLRKGDEQGARRAMQAEKYFYQALGRSRAAVVVSLDIHNAGMWPTGKPDAPDWSPTIHQFRSFLDFLFTCGIAPERIINPVLSDWLALPKADRGKLMTWL